MSALELVLKGAVDVTSHFLKSASDRFHEDPTSFFAKEVTKTENFAELQSALLKNRIRIGGPTNQDQILECIQRHLEYVERWCSTVYMKDMVSKRQLSDVYVGLDTYLIPRQRHVADSEKTTLRASSEILTDLTSNVVILGLPGSGKTTTIKDFLHKFSAENDSKFSKFSFPLLVRLRDLDTGGNTSRHLFTHLASIIGYAPDFSVPQEIRDTHLDIDAVVFDLIEQSFYRFLSELRPLIVLDGFDEIASQEAKRAVFEELHFIEREFPKVRILMTCRTGEMPDAMYAYRQYEIAPLSEEQIRSFSKNWIEEVSEQSSFVDAKWKNNLIESDHAAMKRLLGYRQSFRSLRSAKATLSGIETIRTIKRGHIYHKLPGVQGEIRFINQLFNAA